MKYLKFSFFLAIIALLTSCNFTETMYLNEDGSGKMSILLDASEMAGMGMGEMLNGEKDVDSLLDFEQFFEDKKDSISKLPIAEQEKLKRFKNLKLHTVMNATDGIMTFDLFMGFKNIKEANNLFDGFSQLENFGRTDTNEFQETGKEDNVDIDEQTVKVKFSFKSNKFKRDAYIIDQEKYQTQIDSIAGMEAFLSGTKYRLEYHFPRKIKKTSQESATFSADGKTVFYEVDFLEYMKDPDLLDIEVVLEKN